MEFEKIIELIHAVSDSSLTHFQMEEGNLKISMKTDKAAKGMPVVLDTCSVQAQPMAAVSVSSAGAPDSAQSAEEKLSGNVVKAPLVGTYYASSSPESRPFVKVGDTVKKGQVLGIVEAMKLMNEIESEFDGTVAEILVENEQVIEYGQPMFVIK